MKFSDGIAYAFEKQKAIKVCDIKPLDNYTLWLSFNTGEVKQFDFNPLLDKVAYQPLKDIKIFKDVYIDHGVPVWNDGNIDVSPEFLYENSIAVKNNRIEKC